MLLSIFQRKPTLDHKRVEIRLKALAELPDSAQDTFVKLARQDPDPQVRTQSVDRLTSLDHLKTLADEEIEIDHVAKRIATLVIPEHPLFTDPRVVAIRLRNLKSASDFLNTASCLERPDAIAEALIKLPDSEMRLEVVSSLRDADLLAEIEKTSRRKDKNVHREARKRLSEHKQLDGERTRLIQTAHELIEMAGNYAPADPHYDSKRDALEAKWQRVLAEIAGKEASMSAYGSVESALETLESLLPERTAMEYEPDAEDIFAPIFQALANCQDNESEIDAIEQQWLALTLSNQAPLQVAEKFYRQSAEIRSRIEKKRLLSERWEKAAPLLKPIPIEQPEDQLESWERAWKSHRAALARIRDIKKFLDAKRTEETETDLESKLRETLSQCEDIVKNCDELRSKVLECINASIASLDEMVAAGESKRADSKAISIRNLIQRLPAKDRRNPSSALSKRYPAIRELNRWKSFAEAPKRKELCECMETLAIEPLPPNEQIGQIKALRADWLKLGRPKTPMEQRLADQFDAAAEKAFKPCAERFQQEKETRKKNLELRKQICEQLESYNQSVDWDQPDWKSVVSILNTARRAWRDASPVERSHMQKIGKQWREITKSIQERIDQHTRDSEEKKRQIIKRAQAAYEDTSLDNNELANLVKNLQTEWKGIGPARRNNEQKLWNQFREICDQVFEDRANRFYQRKAEIEEVIQQARSRVAEITEAVTSSIEHGESPDLWTIQQARIDIDQLHLPERTRSELQRDLSTLSRTARESIAMVQAQEWSQKLKAVLKLDEERAECEESKDGVPDNWSETAGSKNVWFEKRQKSDHDTLLALTLRAEMLAGLESPPEDAQRRIALQVENLQREMREIRRTEKEVLEEIIREWATFAQGSTELRKRFQEAVRTALEKIPKSSLRN